MMIKIKGKREEKNTKEEQEQGIDIENNHKNVAKNDMNTQNKKKCDPHENDECGENEESDENTVRLIMSDDDSDDIYDGNNFDNTNNYTTYDTNNNACLFEMDQNISNGIDDDDCNNPLEQIFKFPFLSASNTNGMYIINHNVDFDFQR